MSVFAQIRNAFGLSRRAEGGAGVQSMEKRAASGFTAEVMSARGAYISGRSGLAELTATAQACVSLWENGFVLADVKGSELLTRRTMAMIGRSLALRGESLFLLTDAGLVPCSDWDVSTRNGKPVAYRVSIAEAGGGRSETALAAEVLHTRIGSDPSAPYFGTAPLKRAQLTASLLQAVESSLCEVFEDAPIGSQIVPFPESNDVDLEKLGRGFRGRRGRVLLRESVNVSAAGGPAPATDWRPVSVSPDLQRAMTTETLAAARISICSAFGLLATMFDGEAQGPAIREAQRHLAQWTLQPIASILAEEASDKLGGDVSIDVLRPLQAFDAGGAARALSSLVGAMAQAKEAGLSPEALASAFQRLDWEQ